MVRTDDRQAPPDPFPLPAFEHRLWGELAALHAEWRGPAETAGTVEGSGPAGGGGPPGGHRRAVAPLLAAAGVVAVAAVGVGWLVVGGDEDRRAADDEAGVSAEAPAAAAPGEDAVVVVTTSDGTTVWRDEATGAWRQVGVNTDVEVVVAVGDDPGLTVIEHDRREYWTASTEDMVDQSGSFADRFREQMEAEAWVLEGTEVVDGRTLERHVAPPGVYRLCGIQGGPPGFSEAECELPGADRTVFPGVRHVVWIDPATGRPVREVEDYLGDDTVDLDATIEFRPRTPENLALVEAEVPPGYRLVEPPDAVIFTQPGGSPARGA